MPQGATPPEMQLCFFPHKSAMAAYHLGGVCTKSENVKPWTVGVAALAVLGVGQPVLLS